MKLRKPWMIKLAAKLGSPMVRLWMGTIRFRLDTRGQRTNPLDPKLHERYIYALWHDSLFLVSAFRAVSHKAAALISKSADGELIAQFCEASGMTTIRGSSTRGGMDAVNELMRVKHKYHVVVAPDGPHGPRHEVKRGLVYLASWTGMRIVPLGVGFRDAWHAKSWDRMSIPKPRSLVTCVAGPVIEVPANVGKTASEHYRQMIERSMSAATDMAEAWAHGKSLAVDWSAVSAPAA